MQMQAVALTWTALMGTGVAQSWSSRQLPEASGVPGHAAVR